MKAIKISVTGAEAFVTETPVLTSDKVKIEMHSISTNKEVKSYDARHNAQTYLPLAV